MLLLFPIATCRFTEKVVIAQKVIAKSAITLIGKIHLHNAFCISLSLRSLRLYMTSEARPYKLTYLARGAES